MDKVIITIAVTGDGAIEKNPAIPYKPGDIAQAAIDSWKAGAAIAHIHVRDPETGAAGCELSLFKEVKDIITSETDMIVNLSTCGLSLEGDLDYIIERRLEPISLKPEICTLDMGPINLTYKNKTFLNPTDWSRRALDLMKENGVKPELDIFEIGHSALACHYIERGVVVEPPLFCLCMGVGWGMPGTVENLSFFKEKLPANANWSTLGVGRVQLPMISAAILMGGHVRVGLEDNLYIRKGVLASSNTQIVQATVDLIHRLEREVASPDEARDIIGLPKS